MLAELRKEMEKHELEVKVEHGIVPIVCVRVYVQCLKVHVVVSEQMDAILLHEQAEERPGEDQLVCVKCDCI